MTLIVCSVVAYSQCPKALNIIFTIDDKLLVEPLSSMTISDQTGKQIECTYFPGRILPADSSVRLDFSGSQWLRLKFDFSTYIGKKYKVMKYVLDIPISYFEKEYLVINIYNLNNKHYSRRFSPLDPERNYTFELYYAGGQLLRHKN